MKTNFIDFHISWKNERRNIVFVFVQTFSRVFWCDIKNTSYELMNFVSISIFLKLCQILLDFPMLVCIVTNSLLFVYDSFLITPCDSFYSEIVSFCFSGFFSTITYYESNMNNKGFFTPQTGRKENNSWDLYVNVMYEKPFDHSLKVNVGNTRYQVLIQDFITNIGRWVKWEKS